MADARGALGEAVFEEAWARGRGMGFEGAVGYALGVDGARGSPGPR